MRFPFPQLCRDGTKASFLPRPYGRFELPTTFVHTLQERTVISFSFRPVDVFARSEARWPDERLPRPGAWSFWSCCSPPPRFSCGSELQKPRDKERRGCSASSEETLPNGGSSYLWLFELCFGPSWVALSHREHREWCFFSLLHFSEKTTNYSLYSRCFRHVFDVFTTYFKPFEAST